MKRGWGHEDLLSAYNERLKVIGPCEKACKDNHLELLIFKIVDIFKLRFGGIFHLFIFVADLNKVQTAIVLFTRYRKCERKQKL